ncbi:DEAD/DEAH box helicase [Paenibacillus ehimensis]|uniref:DEAD/DEAH box helicase n=1 Tax=Paenibacillus ehimensis TaxID=79264 RepID=UPI00046E93A6|nr:SNF2-related protein [Paenibacillus ehimensis]
MAVAFQTPKLHLKNNKLVLQIPFADRELAKHIPGYKWDAIEKAWTYPTRPEVLEEIKRFFPHVLIDWEAYNAVEQIADRERTARRLKDEADMIEVEMPVLVKPFEHQKKAFAIGTMLPNVAYLMEMGCGKSLTAVATAGHRYKFNGLRRVLVVCPFSVVPVWPREFADYAAFPTEVITLNGSSAQKAATLQSWTAPEDTLQVAVINYESTWRIEAELKTWIQGGMIICDESQRIKTPGASQSKALHRIGAVASYRLILSGTPVTQSPLDFFSQYKFLDPQIFGTSFTAFKARYAVFGGFENRQIVGYRNMNELVQKAHSIAFRVTKAEALDLPDETTQSRYVELSRDTKRVYEEIKREAIAELTNGTITAPNVLTKLLRLSQVTGGFVTDEDGTIHQVGTDKFDVFRETMGDLLEAGKKVVVFARFIEEIRAITRFLDDSNIGYRYIMGEVGQSERGEAVQAFQTLPEVRVFVAQIATAGLGITLTAADTAIFYSMDFSLANHEQAKARIHRIGQKFPVTYIYLLGAGTVDEQIFKALKDKKNIADTVVDRWREFM